MLNRLTSVLAATSIVLAAPLWAYAHTDDSHHDANARQDTPAKQISAAMGRLAKPQAATSQGSVTIDGQKIDYISKAGTLTLHGNGEQEAVPTARIFYTAYFKKGADAGKRPVTFIYNGGPGSSTLWLHMGAFGPKRVQTADDTHTPAAPYTLVNNEDSLLNVSDLVFIDAPGTGFSRLIADTAKDKDRKELMEKRRKHFYSVDGDAHAFADFITGFLSQYDRWNSPKYLFGESYGTTRSAVIANILSNEDNVDLNGVILLSQILNFDTSIDGPDANPGMDLPYILALPTFAATAWYHHKLDNAPDKLQPLLDEVETFATGPYAQALMAGASLPAKRKDQIAQKLHQYTGLPVAYLKRANLRVNGGEFEKNLLGDNDESTGRLDTRFAGPSIDPLSQGSQYDPQSSSISSAYVSSFHHYLRHDLKVKHASIPYRAATSLWQSWDFSHTQPGSDHAAQGATNVMPDLANAMKTNPNLKILLTGGYYDLATPFFAAEYEMQHMPIPASLQKNISYDFFPSGHMVYAHLPSLDQLHARVSKFIQATDNVDASDSDTDETTDQPAQAGTGA